MDGATRDGRIDGHGEKYRAGELNTRRFEGFDAREKPITVVEDVAYLPFEKPNLPVKYTITQYVNNS